MGKQSRFCLIISFAFILVRPSLLIAQDSTELKTAHPVLRNAIALVPQYALYRGIRVDIERRLKGGDHWFVFAHQFYLDVENSTYYYNEGDYGDYESMVGVGLNIYFKTIAFKSRKINAISGLPRQSIYLQAGPNFQYFSLQNEEEVATPFTDINGTTYFLFNQETVNKSIYRFGAVVDFGWQLAFDRFLFDLYLGMGIKYSLDGEGNLIKDSNTQWVRPTFSGILLDGGLRFGLFF